MVITIIFSDSPVVVLLLSTFLRCPVRRTGWTEGEGVGRRWGRTRTTDRDGRRGRAYLIANVHSASKVIIFSTNRVNELALGRRLPEHDNKDPLAYCISRFACDEMRGTLTPPKIHRGCYRRRLAFVVVFMQRPGQRSGPPSGSDRNCIRINTRELISARKTSHKHNNKDPSCRR